MIISVSTLDSNEIQTTTPIYRDWAIQWDMYLNHSTKLEENRKWKIQDGGPRYTNISLPRLDSNAIPTAIPMFVGQRIPVEHVSMRLNK